MNIHQKEIVLLPYPFTNFDGSKVRPAVIVSNDDFNAHSKDRVMVPLTSVIKNDPYSILVDNQDLVSGELVVPSRIRVDKVLSIEKGLIIMKIGTLSDTAFEKVKSILFEILSN